MFRRVRRSQPCATLPLPLPGGVLRACASALPRLRGPLNRLDTDLIADNSELQYLLGIHPRAFDPDPSMWFPAGQ